jgi:hypothetical protein
MAGARMDRAEQDRFGILARDQHGPRGPHRGPRAPQRRKEAQQRPVGEQDRVGGLDRRSQLTAESPFFCARCVAR